MLTESTEPKGESMTRKAEVLFEIAVREYYAHRTADGWTPDAIAEHLSTWAKEIINDCLGLNAIADAIANAEAPTSELREAARWH